jgi:RimJ/RimL family protein N-acetyltransferase
MSIRPIVNNDDLAEIAGWLGNEENRKWLDIPAMPPSALQSLKLFLHRGQNIVFVFTNHEGRAIGLTGIRGINPHFKTGELWVVLGDKRYSGRYTFRALEETISHAFDTLQLKSLYAWTVASNWAAQRLARRLGWRVIGTQRRCHIIDGVYCDRVLFDLTPEDFAARKTGRAVEHVPVVHQNDGE